MEITCNRCHQPIPADGLYCSACGLPQLTYSGEEALAPAQSNQWEEALEQVSAVEWRPALRFALLLAVPAGLLFGGTFFLGLLGLIWIAAAAAWAVTLYVRGQRTSRRGFWLTTGAGARIGLVTGLIAGWTAFAATGASLYAERYLFHQGKEMDDAYQTQVVATTTWLESSGLWQSLVAASQDPQTAQTILKAQMARQLSPEGRAGAVLSQTVTAEFMLLVFAVAGGAIGARLLAGAAKPASRD